MKAVNIRPITDLKHRTKELVREVAAQDVERLASYVLEEAPLRAEQILLRIISRGESLELFPQRGRTPPELRAIGDQTWLEIQEPPWRIIYRIAGKKTVEIHGVF